MEAGDTAKSHTTGTAMSYGSSIPHKTCCQHILLLRLLPYGRRSTSSAPSKFISVSSWVITSNVFPLVRSLI